MCVLPQVAAGGLPSGRCSIDLDCSGLHRSFLPLGPAFGRRNSRAEGCLSALCSYPFVGPGYSYGARDRAWLGRGAPPAARSGPRQTPTMRLNRTGSTGMVPRVPLWMTMRRSGVWLSLSLVVALVGGCVPGNSLDGRPALVSKGGCATSRLKRASGPWPGWMRGLRTAVRQLQRAHVRVKTLATRSTIPASIPRPASPRIDPSCGAEIRRNSFAGKVAYCHFRVSLCSPSEPLRPATTPPPHNSSNS